MGQVCSGEKGEANKGSAFDDSPSADDIAILEKQKQHIVGSAAYQQQQLLSQSQLDLQQQQQQQNPTNSQHHEMGGVISSIEEKERLRALREEQARLNMIVSVAGRGMVSIRSTRGSTGYYDQGFAAALAQHLEQTTSFPNRLPIILPPPPNDEDGNHRKVSDGVTTNSSPLLLSSGNNNNNNNDKAGTSPSSSAKAMSPLFTRLAQPPWEGLELASGGGMAGCAGEDPNRFMDNVAESLLDTVVPAKQQLFAGVKPMIENLL